MVKPIITIDVWSDNYDNNDTVLAIFNQDVPPGVQSSQSNLVSHGSTVVH